MILVLPAVFSQKRPVTTFWGMLGTEGFDVIVEFVVLSNTKQISSYRMDHSQSFTQLSIWNMREFDGQRQEHRGMLILLFFRLVTGLLV